MNLNHKTDSRAGVTLIEMLVVVTIIGLFAAIVAPRLFSHGAEAAWSPRSNRLRRISSRSGSTSSIPAAILQQSRVSTRCVSNRPAWNSGTVPTSKRTWRSIPGRILTSTSFPVNTAMNRTLSAPERTANPAVQVPTRTFSAGNRHHFQRGVTLLRDADRGGDYRHRRYCVLPLPSPAASPTCGFHRRQAAWRVFSLRR